MIKRIMCLLTVFALVISILAITGSQSEARKKTKKIKKKLVMSRFEILSPAFKDGASIPVRFAAFDVDNGEELSVPLFWRNAPKGAASFALTMVDVSANNFVHWMVANIPASTRSLKEGASGDLPEGVSEYENGMGDIGYAGPQPPAGSGVHKYVITVYALNQASIQIDDYADLSRFNAAIDGKVLARASITGTFTR